MRGRLRQHAQHADLTPAACTQDMFGRAGRSSMCQFDETRAPLQNCCCACGWSIDLGMVIQV